MHIEYESTSDRPTMLYCLSDGRLNMLWVGNFARSMTGTNYKIHTDTFSLYNDKNYMIGKCCTGVYLVSNFKMFYLMYGVHACHLPVVVVKSTCSLMAPETTCRPINPRHYNRLAGTVLLVDDHQYRRCSRAR